MNEPVTPPVRRKGSLLHTVRAVAWSFIGIRKNSGYQDDLAKLNPLHVVAVAIASVVAQRRPRVKGPATKRHGRWSEDMVGDWGEDSVQAP